MPTGSVIRKRQPFRPPCIGKRQFKTKSTAVTGGANLQNLGSHRFANLQAQGARDIDKSSARTAARPSRSTRAGYADILKQVRDSDFEHQLHEQLELAEP